MAEIGGAEPIDAPQSMETSDGDEKAWLVEKSQLEQENFNINQELFEAKERLKDVSRKNEQLVEELAQHSAEIAEFTKSRRHLESARNELVDKNIELEAMISRLKIEKEERDNAIINCNKEKQAAMVELFALKDQLKIISEEKASLAMTVEMLNQEKRTLNFEREKYNSERELFSESKTWLLHEMSERDATISSLRIELSSKDMKMANEKLQLESEMSTLNFQMNDLKEKLELSKKQVTELQNRMQEAELDFHNRLASLEAEARTQNELINIERNARDEAWNTAQSLREELVSKDAVYNEVRECLTQFQEELENEKAANAAEIEARDKTIAQLNEELSKINELMKSKHAVNLDVTEQELAELSPAAANTVKILKGGKTLTSFVLEQAHLAAELAAQKEQNAELMKSFQELIERIEDSGPDLVNQRLVTEEIYEKVERYEEVIKEAEIERTKLISDRDAAQRELAFTQNELEKYQRDFNFLLEKNAQLIYVNERQNRASDEEWDENYERKVFSTIVDLQKRNVQLENDIEHEKKSAAQAAMAAQNAEMVNLRTQLAHSQESEKRLHNQIEQLKLSLKSMTEQADRLKDLVRDSVSASEARNARIKAEQAVSDKMVLEMKLNRLEEYTKVLKEERDKKETILNQRIEASESAVNNIKQTNITLQVMLDTQKALTAELQQAIDSYQKEAENANREREKLLTADVQKSQQIDDLNRRLMEASEAVGCYRVEKRALEDELSFVRNDVARLKIENETQRNVLAREQQLMMSLNDMSTRLSRVETEKLSFANTQAEALRFERDSLKASSARLADQLTRAKNDAKLIQSKLEQELSAARAQLAEKEQQISFNESELSVLRSKLTSVQAQYTGADATGMTPDRLKKEYQQLKTRNQFLEKQIDELKGKLIEIEAEKAKRDNETAAVEKHSSILEENLKETEKMGAMERERLESKLENYEKDLTAAREQLVEVAGKRDELQEQLDSTRCEFEKKMFDYQRDIDILRMQLNDSKAQREEATSFVNEAKTTVQENEARMIEMNRHVEDANRRLMECENEIARLRSQLNDKSMALLAETEAKRQADELRAVAENSLRKKIEESEIVERESRQKLEEYSAMLNNLSQQFEACASAISTRSTNSEESMIAGSSDDNGLVASLTNVLQFVRQDKDNALNRALNAEVEMRRLRAETAEFERSRNEMLAKIRDLETERTANAAALVERAKLLEKVEALMNVQNLNTQLNNEKLTLTETISSLQQQKAAAEKKCTTLTAKCNEMGMKMSTMNQELLQKRKESELLKQRLETSGRGQNSALQTQLEQAKALIAQVKEEAAKAEEQAKAAEKLKIKAEENAKQYQQKFNQTRQLALKYREEV
ncbi:unnamed protein product [Caenorhabditis bovis]|uniref:Nucleoprotein TPR n=1 Tax=Caenorhabditis bovis TaxID=2654633 RepID=A0A8S1FBS7_9PELO|nr:unnamed protein product [Caenorhabditis bovis]